MWPVFEQSLNRYQELERQLADPAVIGDRARYTQVAKEHGSLGRQVKPYLEFKKVAAEMAQHEQLLAAETVLRRNATVRSTERLVARLLGIGRSRRKQRVAEQAATSAAIEDLQNRLQEFLATHVTVHHGEKRGRIEIEYYGNDDLQRIVNALGLPPSAS